MYIKGNITFLCKTCFVNQLKSFNKTTEFYSDKFIAITSLLYFAVLYDAIIMLRKYNVI